MGTITTTDGTEIFYKDWGSGQPIVFSHGWPLSATTGTPRCCSSCSTATGSSPTTGAGTDAPPRPATVTTWTTTPTTWPRVTAHLDLHDAVHVGHSTGGGEVVHYIARHGESRVAKAVLISAVPPLMVQTDANPGGLPKSVFDGLQAQLAANRSEFYREPAVGALLRLQPARRGAVGGDHRELVAPGHDGRRQGPLRRHRRLLPDRLHRGPQEDHGAGPGDARRRRPDRALRRLRTAVREARAERDAEDLRRDSRTACRPRRPTTINADLLAFIQS